MKKYFFIHIPKTAGTSFKKMLFSEFKKDRIFANEFDQKRFGWKYPPLEEYLFLSQKDIDTIDLLVGHIPFFLNRIFEDKDDVLTFTFLRDPVNRVVSNLNYIKFYLSSRHLEYRKYEKYSIEKIYDELGPNMANIQIRYFADRSFRPPYYFNQRKKLDDIGFENAKVNLDKVSFIGITELFSQSVELFNRRNFGIKIGDVVEVNKTPQNEEVQNDFLRRITTDNKLDIEFYEYGKRLFFQRCSS